MTDNIEQARVQRNVDESNSRLQFRLRSLKTFEQKLYALEEFFSEDYSEVPLTPVYGNGGFAGSSFVENSVAKVLRERYSDDQILRILRIVWKSTQDFVGAYGNFDEDFNIEPGVYFNNLRVVLDTVNAGI